MAIVKANYIKRGRGVTDRAKATLRYMTHRRDQEGARVTRTLFGFDGTLSKAQAYTMIDEVPRRGTMFYRVVVSPDPKREDRFKDLSLADLTIDTMLALEASLGRSVQFIATIHDDHSPHRHVHALLLLHGRRLTRADFAILRVVATGQARTQRRERDQGLGLASHRYRSPSARRSGRFRRSGVRAYLGYTCSLCGYHLLLPYTASGYRCPGDGLWLRRDGGFGYQQTVEFIPLSFWYDAPLTSQYSYRRHHPWLVYGLPSCSLARWSVWISRA